MTETILVTGASRGIGRAIALRLARDGFDIVVHCRSRVTEANVIADDIRALGRQARVVAFDVSARNTVRETLERDVAEHGAYYGVILNAGMTRDAPFPALTDEQWDGVIDANLNGFYNVLRPLVMAMIQRRKPGRIVTLSSAAGMMGNRGQVNYSAAKGGLIAATKALALELAKRRITVNCVAPGWIATDMTDDAVDQQTLAQVPMRRVGEPEEVAGAISFLCSADAAYITRQVIAVNGGLY
ncbi:3-oxoacyl-ACP reductase FabG [Phytohalomonas tamaricis]|uniref:3-oxoacyl-ACP reductase FabG n=1 Tax=Phytohalomonas tamaricis TaxID=2081032 RepID=UPI000D0B4F00|nr:3-oxoacyl-ACP reductase FabG [Phytohalomonas tamaricis]